MKAIAIISILFVSLSVNAQLKVALEEMTIGDKIPDLQLSNLINYSKNNSSLYSLTNNKVLIIDFFATWCGPCVGELPKLDSLKRKFGSRLEILVVSSEKKEIIQKFVDGSKATKGTTLIFYPEDKYLSGLFKHKIIPHEVWIDNMGQVVAITDQKAVTDANISTIINGNKPALPLKKDLIGYNSKRPLLADGNGGEDTSFLARSIISRYTPGLGTISTYNFKNTGYVMRFLGTNMNILSLFNCAYSKMQFFPSVNMNRMILQFKSTPFNKMSDSAIVKQLTADSGNMFSYEIIVPKETPDSVFFNQYMINDLNKVAPVKATIEKHVVECLVITKLNNGKSPSKPTGEKRQFLYDRSSVPLRLTQIKYSKVSDLITLINSYYHYEKPILDETNYPDLFDMDLNIPVPGDHLDVGELRRSLNGIGFDIIVDKRNTEVLVLTDN